MGEREGQEREKEAYKETSEDQQRHWQVGKREKKAVE